MSSGGLFSSDMLLGITAYGIKVEADLGSVRSAGLYERFKPKALVFYADWFGIELSTGRHPR